MKLLIYLMIFVLVFNVLETNAKTTPRRRKPGRHVFPLGSTDEKYNDEDSAKCRSTPKMFYGPVRTKNVDEDEPTYRDSPVKPTYLEESSSVKPTYSEESSSVETTYREEPSSIEPTYREESSSVKTYRVTEFDFWKFQPWNGKK